MDSDATPAPVAVSKVLDADDILIEILVRIGFPTTLVCAALVCKRWLGHVANPAFLRRFRKLHPPRLLGVYVEEMGLRSHAPPFVPVFPEDPEIADVIRRADFSLDDYNEQSVTSHDCRNGSVFITLYHYSDCGVHTPLWPGRELAVLPPLPEIEVDCIECYVFNQVLSKQEGDAVSYFYLYVDCTDDEVVEPEFKVHLYALQDGFWIPHHPLAMEPLPRPVFEPRSVLVGDKIYIPAGLNNIIVLDMMTSSLSTIQLPQDVEHGETGTTMLARADDDSGVYLIHVEGFELRAWLHNGENWNLVDIICLREMCANLGLLSDEHTLLLMKQVVDYGDFLFLEMSGWALHLDIKCRTLRKVYQAKEGHLIGVNPFMMIWPATFPTLKYDQEMECEEEEETMKLLGEMQIVSDDIMEEG